jgi:DNA helicase-2/ATP-dependent DNA helicase PcrA
MKYVADLHIHSLYSRSTSKNCNLQELKKWALVKGINILGTGDFTHPAWYTMLKESLVPGGNGFFTLKEGTPDSLISAYKTDNIPFAFCLQAEISSIYKKNGKTRKVHSLIYAPDLEIVARINAKLSTLGNISSDGRPILGLDPKHLLEILLDISPDCHLIPAHIWTPWFSLFGSKSGFDAIEECFEDLSKYIFALETGLSSDPPMNWRVSALDRFSLVSNSDAHSPAKLMREANLFATELSYYGMFKALQEKEGFLGTLEFFPEEGKYHYDGHRKCNVCLNPAQSLELANKCPVCGKMLTIGVMHRVLELADRDNVYKPPFQKDYSSLLPLQEILAEILGKGTAAKSVSEAYWKIIASFGNEYNLLMDVPLEEIAGKCGLALAEAIKRMRRTEIHPKAGYDGEFGVIKIFKPHELELLSGQLMLFKPGRERQERDTYNQAVLFESARKKDDEEEKARPSVPLPLNASQQAVAAFYQGAAMVTAGPGTGKTGALAAWIFNLISNKISRPENILAITFTNKAAREMRERLQVLLGDISDKPTICTFHALCFDIIKNHFPQVKSLYDEAGRKALLQYLYPQGSRHEIQELSKNIEKYLDGSEVPDDEETETRALAYQKELKAIRGVDIAALISEVNLIFAEQPEILAYYRERYKYLAIDEFQDINSTQYKLLCALIGPTKLKEATAPGALKGVLAIGDPDQAIYGFRGSDAKLFFRFQKDYQAKHFALTLNYRSTETIIEAAAAVIAHNSFKSGLKLKTSKQKGKSIVIAPLADEVQEAQYITQIIKALVGGTDFIGAEAVGSYGEHDFSFSDIAVLVRTHAVAKTLYPVFERQGIPVAWQEEISLLEEQPYSLLSSYLHLLYNKQDVIAFRDILTQSMSDLSPPELSTLTFIFGQEQGNMTDILGSRMLKRSISSEHLQQLEELIRMLEFVEATIEYQGIHKGVFLILDKIIPARESPENKAKIQILLDLARSFNHDLGGFIRYIFLCTLESQGLKNAEKVNLLTFHAAKGLEFPVVIIAGAEEGIIPLASKKADIEEERRLFYVALTRAKGLAYITHALKRSIYDHKSDQTLSRFVEEIPPELKQVREAPRKQETFRQPTFF